MLENLRTNLPYVAGLVLASAVLACDSGDDEDDTAGDSGGTTGSATTTGTGTTLPETTTGTTTGDVPPPPPLYAMLSQVYGPDDRTIYVLLTDTLDPVNVALDQAREFAGVTNFNGINGRLLISDGSAPIITEYDITEDFQWIEGRTVSFAAFPLEDNANWYAQFVLDDHTAYLPFEGYKRIIWDPTDMVIKDDLEDSNLQFELNGLLLSPGGNRNGFRFDGPIMQSFFWHDADWYLYGSESVIASYDPATHMETSLITVPCPALSNATKDENGYIYYSTWGYSPVLALYGVAPAPCVARITPERTLDAAWTTDLTAMTEGRYGGNFRYIGNGKAVANILHHELLNADFTGPLDPAVYDLAGTSGPHWKVWLFDLNTQTGAPLQGVTVDVGPGAQFAVLEGRTFVFLPYEDWGRTKVYELDAAGVATEHFDIVGDLFKWVKIR